MQALFLGHYPAVAVLSIRFMLIETLRGSYVHLIPSALGFVVFTCLSVISLLRGRKGNFSLLFAALCFMGGFINLDTVLVSLIRSKALALAIDRLVYLFFVFSVPIYVRFIHCFLEVRGRRWVETGALAFSVLFGFLTQTPLFISDLNETAFGRVARAGIAFHFFIFFAGAAVLYGLSLLARSLRRTQNKDQKNRVKYIFGGVGIGAVLLLLHYLPVSGVSIFSPGSLSFIPALALSYGVLKYDLLDFGEVVRMGTVYLALTGAVAVFYILIIYAFHVLFTRSGPADSVGLPLLFAALIVLIFDPLRKKTQLLIDRVLFKGRYDYRRILGEVRQFVSEQVFHALRNKAASILPANRKVTILFCDIRNFTALARKFNPEEIARLLDSYYFSPLDNIIFENNGTLDKHIGDGIMGIFGAPLSYGDDALRAVTTAIRMQEEIRKLNRILIISRRVTLSVGIGISTGEAMAGIFGSNRKKEYTVFGEAVNLASRLEHLAGGGEILVCEETFREVNRSLKLEKLKPVNIKGMEREINIYRVLEEETPAAEGE